MLPQNTQELRAYYSAKVREAESALAEVKKNISGIAAGRLIVFAAALAAAIWLYQYGLGFSAAALLMAALPFLWLMQRHDRLFRKKEFTASLLTVFQNEMLILDGKYEGFEAGEEFSEPEHPYTADLDIFGPGGFFQYLNRTGTRIGKERLAYWLKAPAKHTDILQRQEVAKELTLLDEWMQSFQAKSKGADESSSALDEFSEWFNLPPYFLNNKFLYWLIRILPVITIAAFVLTVWFLPLRLALGIATIQLLIVGAYTKRINKEHELTAKKYHLLEKYASLIAAIEEHSWQTPKMQQLQQAFKGSQDGAGKSLRKLGKLISALDSRINLLGALISNGLYMRDLHNIYALESWKKNYREEIPHWFEALAEADALVSLGTLAFNHPSFTYPELQEGDFYLEAEGLAHPLINEGKRVSNAIKIEGWAQIMLITGSNMGGKSTFLRAVGINMVLAMCGAPVCARSLSLTPVFLFSSMRVGDSIRNSESTFYAELKRLKTIIDKLAAGEKIFILLDEILRGTNSADKLTGSEALIRQLVALHGSGIIATHDLALTRLEQEYPQNVHNYNFEVQIIGDRFQFDYFLKPGICKVMNATLLMKKMGIRI